MAAVDRDIYASTDGSRYATAIYGVLDASSSRLTLVNAGHPPPLVIHRDGTCELLDTDADLPLGLGERFVFAGFQRDVARYQASREP